jgi:hypothetical protein
MNIYRHIHNLICIIYLHNKAEEEAKDILSNEKNNEKNKGKGDKDKKGKGGGSVVEVPTELPVEVTKSKFTAREMIDVYNACEKISISIINQNKVENDPVYLRAHVPICAVTGDPWVSHLEMSKSTIEKLVGGMYLHI